MNFHWGLDRHRPPEALLWPNIVVLVKFKMAAVAILKIHKLAGVSREILDRFAPNLECWFIIILWLLGGQPGV